MTDPPAPQLARIEHVDLMHTGQWELSTGTFTCTRTDLTAAIGALDCPAVKRPNIKIGHTVPTFDGEPALGWIANLRLSNHGNTLHGDLVGMPTWLKAAAPSAFPTRSVEGARNYRCAIGHVHPFVLTGLALLGVTPPGIGTLHSLQDHPSLTEYTRALYEVAAADDPDTPAGEPFAVTYTEEEPMPTRTELVAAAFATVDQLRTAYHQSAPHQFWITEIQLDPLQLIVASDSERTYRVPVSVADDESFSFGDPVEVEVAYLDGSHPGAVAASGTRPTSVTFASRDETRDETPDLPAAEPEPENTPDPKEDPVSTDLSAFSSRLGLDDTADEAAITAAIDALKAKADTPEPTPEMVAASAAATQQAEQAEAEKGELRKEVTILASQVQQVTTELAAAKAEKAATVKATVIEAAARLGKFKPVEREQWEADYDEAPGAITRVLAAIAPGTAVPVTASGSIGDPEPTGTDDEFEKIMARLDGPVARKAV